MCGEVHKPVERKAEATRFNDSGVTASANIT
jgi:hypothetical protein